ncbi:GntR family transcriptional regulator [Caproiciproducens sp.]|uniref:GntR family transcriptional regulator n=1 Tax=Caproiciproducens sp. TaxID=1954376 RepID=UPI002899BFFD|nr:GntR family transcriptional regulator [Caproiciproducens sp.]
MLYPGNGQALFVQLKETILHKIQQGEYVEGCCLPSERQLAEIYGISRVTVRQALNELVQERVLVKRHGKGTFVAFKRIDQNLDGLLGFVEEFAVRNLKCEVKVEQMRYEVAPDLACAAMQVPKKTRMLMIVRVIYVENHPLALDRTYVPESVAYLVENLDFRNEMLYNFLERSGYRLTEAHQEIGAAIPSSEEARLLNLESTSPVLVIHRTTYVEGGKPIIHNRAVYRADRYLYNLTLKRRPYGLSGSPNLFHPL